MKPHKRNPLEGLKTAYRASVKIKDLVFFAGIPVETCVFLLSFLVAFAVAVLAKWDADTVSTFLLSYFVLGSAAVIRVESLAIKNRLSNPFKKTA